MQFNYVFFNGVIEAQPRLKNFTESSLDFAFNFVAENILL